MYSSRQYVQDSPDAQRLRVECGAYLRELRDAAGISQRQLAKMVGMEYYSMISQIETGKGRVPTHQIRDWAAALNVDSKHLAKELLKYYDPVNFELIFGEPVPVQPKKVIESLEDRVIRLERLLSAVVPAPTQGPTAA